MTAQFFLCFEFELLFFIVSHTDLGRMYMTFDTHKLIFDENYQVIAI
jgi:hypothetical protein